MTKFKPKKLLNQEEEYKESLNFFYGSDLAMMEIKEQAKFLDNYFSAIFKKNDNEMDLHLLNLASGLSKRPRMLITKLNQAINLIDQLDKNKMG